MKKIITFFCIAFYAITTSAQSTGDYRSVKTGNWTDFANVWQRYNGTKWIAATAYPTSADGVITISDTTIVTINVTLAIDQTIVSAGGQLKLLAAYTVTLGNKPGNDLTIDGQMTWAAGTIDGTGVIKLNGSLNWSGGSLKVPLTNEGTVSIGLVYIYVGSTFTNNGTVTWYYNGDIRFYGGIFNNNGVFNAYANAMLDNYSGGGTFNNNKKGVFNVLCTQEMSNNVTFTNKGVMNFITGSFFNNGANFTNLKTMNFSGGAFRNNSAASFGTGTKITGNGSISLAGNTTSFNTEITVPPGITVNILSNSTLGGSGPVNLNGTLNWSYGSITVPITVQPQGKVYIYNYSGYLSNTTLTNNGTVNWSGYDLRFYNGSIINNATFNLNNNDGFTQYNTTFKGSFTNNATGVITKTSSEVTTAGIAFTNKGTIKGIGTINFGANLTNTGIFAPGVGTGTGILTTGTGYKNKTLAIQMNDALPGLGFDRLVVTGNVNLGGDTLKVTASGSMPAGTYTVLTWSGARTGTFKVTQLPAGFTVIYQDNKVMVKVPNNFAGNDVSQPQADDAVKATASDKTFLISPNPASQNLNISFQSNNKSASLKIFDENGKPLLQKTVSPSTANHINISKLTPGSYVVQLNDGELTRSAKFIKQ
ncbi:MAG TPA: T9SS type A sorting domain-containing protein [Parafilimonas sp.]|nr:T9SS type A sorting domain-containing protein [Parafilimonas sp.]